MPELMDIPPIGLYSDRKWKSHEDFRGRGSRIAKWVPRPDYMPPESRLWVPGAPAPELARGGIAHGVGVSIFGRAVVSLFSPAGDIVCRGVADNVITQYGKEWLKNALRMGITSTSSVLTAFNPTAGSTYGATNSVAATRIFVAKNDGTYPADGTSETVNNPFLVLFLSGNTAVESATENTVATGLTVTPTRTKAGTSTTDLTVLHVDSGLVGTNCDVYMRFDFGASEANGTWGSVHWAAASTAGQVQGIRDLLAAPITKDSAHTMKVEYTFAVAIS